MEHRRLCRVAVVLVGLAWLVPPTSGQSFTDETAAAGLTSTYMPDVFNDIQVLRKMSGGVSAFDADGDGLDDIFWPGGSLQPCRLYVNQGDGTFELATNTGLEVMAPVTHGSFADYDDDGDLDLLVLTYQDHEAAGQGIETRNFLFRNDGNLTFTDVAEAAGLKESGRWGASWADFDGDGWLDLVTVSWHANGPPLANDTPTLFFKNNGDGTFSPRAGLDHEDFPHGFSPMAIDYDGDGDMDVLTSGDYETSRVYRNDGRWVFTRVDLTSFDGGPPTDTNGMGAAVGDINHDGLVDWFVTSIYWTEPLHWGEVTGNRMYVNQGDGTFSETTDELGLLDGGWGWGARMDDVQNDARLDVIHVNGWYMALLIPPNPPELQFDTLRVYLQQPDDTLLDEAASYGLADSDQGRGLVTFDYDRDGLLDLLVSNNDTGLSLYRNVDPTAGHFLEVRLAGTLSNSHGIGAKVTASHRDLPTQTRWITHGSNHVSQSPAAAWFGLADVSGPINVRVDWPSGLVSFHRLDVDQHVVLEEPSFGFGPPQVLKK